MHNSHELSSQLCTLYQHCSVKAAWMLPGHLKAAAVIYSYRCAVLAYQSLHLLLVATLAPEKGTWGAHQRENLGLQNLGLPTVCSYTHFGKLILLQPPTVTQSDQTFGKSLLCRGKGFPCRPGSWHCPCLPAQGTSTGGGEHPFPRCGPGSCCFTGQMTNW